MKLFNTLLYCIPIIFEIYFLLQYYGVLIVLLFIDPFKINEQSLDVILESWSMDNEIV
jgi:hypothetical protein